LFQEKATGNPKFKVAKAKGQTEGGTGVNSVWHFKIRRLVTS
jgi:hypothetical protein